MARTKIRKNTFFSKPIIVGNCGQIFRASLFFTTILFLTSLISPFHSFADKVSIQTLLEYLKDKDPHKRAVGVDNLRALYPNAKETIPALIDLLNDDTVEVRDTINRAFENLGVKAVSALIKALKNKDPKVRKETARILGKAKSKRAVPALINALKDDNADVRESVISALGQVGWGAREAIPTLVIALKNQESYDTQTIAQTLEQIATGLQDEVEGGKIHILHLDPAVFGHLNSVAPVLKAHPDAEIRKHADPIRRANSFLLKERELELSKWWLRLFNSEIEYPLWAFLVLFISIYILTVVIIFKSRPLLVLKIKDALPSTDVKIGWVRLPLEYILLIRFFLYRDSLLDAWVEQHIKSARENFRALPTVNIRKDYVPLPFRMDGELVQFNINLNSESVKPPEKLQKAFSQLTTPTRLLVWGEGGDGKTSLAFQMGHWAMREKKDMALAEHPMLPVLIDRKLVKNFLETVQGQLQGLIKTLTPVPGELLGHLLERKRILVIVDHFSEMDGLTQETISAELPHFTTNALVVSSRNDILNNYCEMNQVQPLRIERDRLSNFMHAYFNLKNKSELFKDSDFNQGRNRLAAMMGTKTANVLLAKLFADQMIKAKEAGKYLVDLPQNIPDLIEGYVTELTMNAPMVLYDLQQTHRDIKAIAWECVGRTYRPTEAETRNLVNVLEGEAKDVLARLERLERDLRLISFQGSKKELIIFTLDPLAEYLAGIEVFDQNQDDEEKWMKFLELSDGMEGAPNEIKGFLMAVLTCCETRGNRVVPGSVIEGLRQRVGLDPKVGEKTDGVCGKTAQALEKISPEVVVFPTPASFEKITSKKRDLERLRDKLNSETRDFPDDASCAQLVVECRQLGIITQNKEVLKSFQTLKQYSSATTPILILGESGTGKELFARAGHFYSSRKSKMFIGINIGAIPNELIESELFGHEKNSFSGAITNSKGVFESADKGTLFLDEIGEASQSIQVKMLRALEKKEIQRVGAGESIKVDARVISATNKNLRNEVAKGNFRQDLYCRLNVLKIKLPPLRDRRGDIEILANYFLEKFQKEHGINCLEGYSEEAIKKLQGHSWPGNIRELRNVIDGAVLKAREGLITEYDILLD